MLKCLPKSNVLWIRWLALLVVAAPTGGSFAASAASCDRAAFHPFLDVGHTPQSQGAISARGVTEFDFNLRLGQRIERSLRERGFEKTTLLLSRGEGKPSLATRIAKANLAKADLFVSIHHDSVPEAFIERWEYLGAEGRFSDRFKGHSIFVSAEHRRYTKSLAFGRALGLALKEKGLAYTPHYTEKIMGARQRQLVDKEAGVYRFDKLAVLTLTNMPSVLFEAGSIINRDEELAMESPERQTLIAEAVADAVERFCTPVRTRRAVAKS